MLLERKLTKSTSGPVPLVPYIIQRKAKLSLLLFLVVYKPFEFLISESVQRMLVGILILQRNTHKKSDLLLCKLF